MRRFACAAVLGWAACGPAFAEQDIEAMMRSQALLAQIASILGSEEACGLPLDPAAMERWVAENVDPADPGFTATLPMIVRGNALQIEQMTPAAKAAHCASARMQADHFKLLVP